MSIVSTNNVVDLVSPNLLERAKSIASEHARLSLQNAEDYDVSVAKKIGELGPVTTALKEYEDAQNVRRQISQHNKRVLTVSSPSRNSSRCSQTRQPTQNYALWQKAT